MPLCRSLCSCEVEKRGQAMLGPLLDTALLDSDRTSHMRSIPAAYLVQRWWLLLSKGRRGLLSQGQRL